MPRVYEYHVAGRAAETGRPRLSAKPRRIGFALSRPPRGRQAPPRGQSPQRLHRDDRPRTAREARSSHRQERPLSEPIKKPKATWIEPDSVHFLPPWAIGTLSAPTCPMSRVIGTPLGKRTDG